MKSLTAIISTICVIFINDTAATRHIPGFPFDNRGFALEPIIPIYGDSVGSNEVWKSDELHFIKRNNISDYRRNYLIEKAAREVKDQPQMLCKEIRTSLNVGENDKGYDYRPSTINLVLCDNKISDRSLAFQCGVDQCRNNIVDVDIYRKKKNSDDNCWEFVTSMPVSAGCECHGLKAEYTKQPKKKQYPSVLLEGRNMYQKRAEEFD